MPDPIKPTAADRQAASNYLREYSFDQKSEKFHQEMLAGQRDVSMTVQAFARHAQQARDQALEEAASAMENLCFFTDIEELREMTKQDLSVRTCLKGAEAIRALKEQRPC